MLLEGLETLCLLASEGTMAKVASRLYISQSAVSKRIAQLEQRLGKKLIEPDGRHIRLTPQARELLARVAPSLAEMKGCWRTARSSRIRPLCPSPAPKPCWRATSPASCTPTLNGIPTLPSLPTTPRSFWTGCAAGCPARDLRRSPAAGPWAVCRTAAGGALLSGGGRSG